MSLTDFNGSYINYNKELPGLLKLFNVKTITIPMLETITLYNDEMHKFDFEHYKVESKPLYEMFKVVAVVMEDQAVSIYPDRVVYSFGRIGLDFPFQDKIMKKISESSNPFSADASASAVANKEGYGLIVEAKGSSSDGIVLGTLPLSVKDLELNIDTLQHNYDIGAMVGLSFFEDIAYGFKVGIIAGKWDEILLKCDFEIPLTTPIPVALSNFFLGLQGMSEVDQTKSFGNIILNSYITGGFKCRLATISLSLETNLKLMGKIDAESAELKIGTFEFDNYLLNIAESKVALVYAYIKHQICRIYVKWFNKL